jgi:anti-anti-sigma factor
MAILRQGLSVPESYVMLVPFGGCRLEMRPDRDRIVVLLRGELDLVNVEYVGAQLEELLLAGWRDMTVNLSAVSFMDVSGVRLLLGLHERSDRAGLAFSAVSASPQVVRILEMTSNLHLLADGLGKHALEQQPFR